MGRFRPNCHPGYGEKDFLNLMDGVEQHLAMVFHRFLEGNAPTHSHPSMVAKLKPGSLSQRASFQAPHSPSAMAPCAPAVKVECHVLPHQDHLTTQEYQQAQGPAGWTAQQGFYVYRNERLLVAGNWFGLEIPGPTKDETHRLARIRLDIPNDADIDWKIDIRKSMARPPVSLRPLG